MDVAAYTLRRTGERIKIEKIPMEVLILLVKRAGILVNRTEIQAALGGSDVFLDQAAAINTAIRKIRLALGDDAEHPRFVETIVGKGYRFIAPVAAHGADTNLKGHADAGAVSPNRLHDDLPNYIFSLGCVLYEMLTRRSPFRGDTAAETLAAILRDQPFELAAADRRIPPRVDGVVQRCLEKNPDHRFQSARDLAFALREILNDSQTPPSSTRTATMRTRVRSGPVLVTASLLIVLSAVVWFEAPARSLLVLPGGGRIHSLAVLPLMNLSADSGQEYFADAMTEELTTRLAKLGNWRVTSRTSVMGYRGTRKKIPEIARELGVDAVIEGSVIRDGSRVKITAQLIDGRTDRHL